MDPSEKYWDKIAAKYARSPIADQAAYEKKLDITRSHMRPDMEVLELGCGTGSTAILHAPYVKHIRATDIAQNMIDIAREKARDAGVTNVTFEHIAIDDLNQPDASLDMVLGLSILHLLDDWREVIADVHRMLKPGGTFITSTACLGGGMTVMKPIIALGRLLGFFPTVKFFTQNELRAAMRDAGFEIVHDWHPGGMKALFLVARKPG
ncbi:class I SAM-dependent methyltransferase [Emcibacter sp.]|uniref:class I SAM-dependent methyltransferase n=1 Tax=Emcibacter sp. TaxID=1979954 RepID=UPI002AA83024|nr:methyltransferase domain-containing protein [Emcibacter sp.]